MTRLDSRLFLFSLLLAGIAGCGGSSSGGPPGGGGGNPTTVTFTFIGAAPAVVATQIGTGTYTAATLAGDELTLTIPSGETDYSVAYKCPPVSIAVGFSLNTEQVIHLSTVDGTSFTQGCAGIVPTAAATVQVNAAAIPGAANANVEVGDQITPLSGGVLNISALLPTGTEDVSVSVVDSTYQALAVKILRNQTVPGALNGGNTVVFSTSDETVPEPITYSNVPSGFSPGPPFSMYFTKNGGSVTLSYDSTSEYLSMPSDAFQAGDYYSLTAAAYSSMNPDQAVSVEKLTSTAGAQSFTFPAPWSYAGPGAAQLPTFDFSYTGFSGMADVSNYASIQWAQGTTSTNSIATTATANYQNGAASISIPDLSGIPGFLAPAASGTSIYWIATIDQGSPFGASPPSGTVQSVQDSGTYTEP